MSGGAVDSDIAVVGGGIIGLACAWRLAGEGHRVALFDAAPAAREASWAAAGMLAPHNEADGPGPLHSLGCASLARWDAFLADLVVPPAAVDHRAHGSLIPVLDAEDAELVARKEAALTAAGVPVVRWSRRELLACEPRFAPAIDGALYMPAGQVNPRALTAVLRQRCAERGVALHYGVAVERIAAGWVHRAGGGVHRAARVVLASGAWTPELARITGYDLPGEPVKGQMALFAGGEDLLTRFVHCRHTYCVPRAGHGIVIGSTMVHDGFDRREDPAAIAALAAGARRLLPDLAERPVRESWTGLRPRLRGGLPLIDAVDAHLVIATGHFRNGVLLTPITAELVADLIAGRASACDRVPFAWPPGDDAPR